MLGSIDSRLSNQRELWTSRLPGRSPAVGAHFPLISIIAATLEYDDIDFANDLSQGVPIGGEINASPGLSARQKASGMTYKEWEA